MAYQLNLTLFTLHSFCLSPNASRDRVPQNTSFPWRIGGDRRRFGYPAMRYESAITRRCHLPCRLVPGTQQETHLHVSPIHTAISVFFAFPFYHRLLLYDGNKLAGINNVCHIQV